ncbi:hypothetical protein MVES1_000185 [Malassezia vespertilionis]|uniref:Uncharacterized protein n=1 Tax=Malassezia vespertilionis TaxID=2020962 RepID=A0A2N1JH88_9BASI|nr:uncharacterized protein MVES1_000185 [Malassezia vespertilionis]PKI85916.1 hypothetical protein MVES_000181 [Malassezia vespertilionis]WFD04861.1 hypothetical protein MVES1_000185 [Malassezia vespertilionis]
MLRPTTPRGGESAARDVPWTAPQKEVQSTAGARTLDASPKAARAPRQPMPPATAQRRASWNIVGILALWCIPFVYPRSIDLYYDTLDALMRTGRVATDTDEAIDAVLAWLRCALTIVFLFNIAEALLAQRHTPSPTAQHNANEVGEAFARSVSSGSPLTRPTETHAPWIPSPLTPTTPSAVTPVRGKETVRHQERRTSGSPFAAGARASTPLQAYAHTGAWPRASRSPTLVDAFAGRSVSRSSPRAPSAAWSPGSPGTELEDAREVELALQDLSFAGTST